jgi:type IV secretory pathway VirB10-like protein
MECQKNELESITEKMDEKTSQLDGSSQECTRMAGEIVTLQKTLAESITVVGLHLYLYHTHFADHTPIESKQETQIPAQYVVTAIPQPTLLCLTSELFPPPPQHTHTHIHTHGLKKGAKATPPLPTLCLAN